MITITETAKQQLKNRLEQQDSFEGIKVSVKKTGCSGWMYVLDFADTINPNDIVLEGTGYKLIIDANSKDVLEGTTLDYKKEILSEGFEFINPNESGRCGCGESFTI